jgi:hypothetical protein
MGNLGIVSVDRDHSNLKVYIESALQVAKFVGDEGEQKRLHEELNSLLAGKQKQG